MHSAARYTALDMQRSGVRRGRRRCFCAKNNSKNARQQPGAKAGAEEIGFVYQPPFPESRASTVSMGYFSNSSIAPPILDL